MQYSWISQKVEYRANGGLFDPFLMEPDEEQLKEALDQVVEAANKDGRTITALTCLPHERVSGIGYAVTLVAVLSKP